jgi:tetratricopeptide (TPR) repeat protein/tRNA A-37 threonylcarbamoyl transferase component Bud32
MIGDYRVIRTIGEGGMGVVYEAEQQQPKRAVALKVIIGGQYVNEALVKMFYREAQTLARLKHPSIAAIYELGRTEDGQHFFAMELVRGESLSDWLEKRNSNGGLSPQEAKLRLALFHRICEAVAYAHQRGVIHRDIKPANIMVLSEPATKRGAIADEEPDRKILDFGLARITDTDLAMSTNTDVGTIQGTLRYMSPEQVRANPDEIDMRTDVYSLGVLVYEMLTGLLPYDMDGSTLYEAAQAICEAPPASLAKSWEGRRRPDRDIDTIILKALEKEAPRRYQSVTALAEDVQRYLANHPILARPPSTMYQLRKMVARHKLGFASAMALVVMLIGLAVSMTVQAGRIARERDRANQEAESARQVSEFLVDLFEVSDPREALGERITAREILDEGAGRIRRELRGQPQLQGRLMDTMGRVYWSLGLYDQARPLLEEALEILRSDLGEEHLDVAGSLYNLGNLFLRTGGYETAQPLFERSLAIREQALGPEHPDVATVMNNLGTLSLEMGKYEAARQFYERALAIREKAFGPDHRDVAQCLNNLAILASSTGDYETARRLYEQASVTLERALGPDHPDVAQSLNNLGNLFKSTRDYNQAQRYYERSLAIREKVLGPEHPDVARSLNNLANLMKATGDYDEAIRLHERSLTIRENSLGPDHPAVTRSLTNLGNVLKSAGDYTRARPLLERALTTRERTLEPAHPRVVTALYNLACLSALQGRRQEALDLLQQASERGFAHKVIVDDPDLASLHSDHEFEKIVADVTRRIEAN